jgi:hypothetical protein
MNHEDIERALAAELIDSISDGWDVKKPGIAFTPNATRPWARGTVILGEPERVAYGHGGYYRTLGMFQIDLMYPTKNNKTEPLFEEVDLLKEVFYPSDNQGRVLSTPSGELVFDQLPAVLPISEDHPAHVQKSLIIKFYYDTPPS